MQNIRSELKQVTPLSLYLQRVYSSFDRIRKEAEGFDYTPPQFGGIFGQRAVANSSSVLEITSFEVE